MTMKLIIVNQEKRKEIVFNELKQNLKLAIKL